MSKPHPSAARGEDEETGENSHVLGMDRSLSTPDGYHLRMLDDEVFEDLQARWSAAWDDERRAVAAEADRLRIAHLDLRSRIVALAADAAPVSIVTADGGTHRGSVYGVGADWLALVISGVETALVPLHAILAIDADEHALRRSVDVVPEDDLGARRTFGFLCRDLARRRSPVRLTDTSGRTMAGTIDRAGADHLDLAIHDRDTPRRSADLRAVRIVPLQVVAYLWVDLAAGAFL